MAGINYLRLDFAMGALDHPLHRARRETDRPTGWIPLAEQLRTHDSPYREADSLSADHEHLHRTISPITLEIVI